MRRITVLILTCIIWSLLSTASYAPAGGVMAAATLQEELEEEEEPPPSYSGEEVEEEKELPPTYSEEEVEEERELPPTYSEEELDLLARLVHAEARGEPLEGKIAVANVVLNRVKSQNFPNTIEQVIYQRVNGRYQFCPVRNGSINQKPTAEAVEAARLALEGKVVVKDALYFYNPRLARCKWIRSRPVVRVIGSHNFAR